MATPDKQEKKRPRKSRSSLHPIADAGSMDKIRDILFGNQAKDCQNRFSTVKTQFQSEAQELKQELLSIF